MPPVRLPERPKPPTGQQMLADIAGADDNDVVFLTGQALDLSDLTPTTPDAAGGAEGGDNFLTEASLAEAERRESAQHSYHCALELLENIAVLEKSPEQLVSQFAHLRDQGAQVTALIQQLQESSKHLTPNTTPATKPKTTTTR
ncbi:hypothetical protein ACOMHN_066092 [Nucella lapillus]